MNNVSDQFVKKTKTHISFAITVFFFLKIVLLMR